MTDRELLEAAAKAAGIVGTCVEGHDGGFYYEGQPDGILIVHSDGRQQVWNPLQDDGDALRLAVQIGISTLLFPACIAAKWPQNGLPVKLHGKDPPLQDISSGQDRYAATRRAIVRAAAAMAL